MASKNDILEGAKTGGIRAVFPFLSWFDGYSRSDFRHDLVAGLTVALVLIPQSMAYAQLAGLPAYYGLYAALLPPLVGALFGSSRHLVTGPVAMVSLLTATALEPLATAGSEAYIAYAILLSLVVGIFQLTMGIFRLGVLATFISHPVINGFANAAALIIATSQLPKLFGVYVEKGDRHYETVYNFILSALDYIHWPTLGIGALAFGIMIVCKKINPKIPSILVVALVTAIISWATEYQHDDTIPMGLISDDEIVETMRELNQTYAFIDRWTEERKRVTARVVNVGREEGSGSAKARRLRHQLELLELSIKERKETARALRAQLHSVKLYQWTTKSGDIFYNRAEMGTARRIKVGKGPIDENAIVLIGGGEVVGTIPRGVPRLRLPEINFGAILELLPSAIIIALIGFMEAIFIAKSMVAKTHQRLDPNRELIGQGLANLVGSVGNSYPVSGSFSKSAVNLEAGAVTGLTSVFRCLVVVTTLLFLTPLLYHLPQATLAAIIVVAVANLIDVKAIIHTWQSNKWDSFITLATFLGTVIFAPRLELGIVIGVSLTLGVYLFRNMKTDIAVLSKHPDGTYRNAEPFNLVLCRNIVVIRFNGPLFFANASNLEEKIIEQVTSMPDLKHILIVGNGITEIDASGEEMFDLLVTRLHQADYEISFSGLNDSILEIMRRTGLYEKIGEENIFRNVALATEHIHGKAHEGSDEEVCPLLEVSFKGLKVAPGVERRSEILNGPGTKPKTQAEGGYDFVI